MSVIVLACVLGGMFIGVFLRDRLPEHHLSGATKDVVRLGSGLIGTIAALVLGLLIASANGTFATQNTQVQQLTAYIVLLDGTLAQYGPETARLVNSYVALSPLWPIEFGARIAPIWQRRNHLKRARQVYHSTMIS